MRPGGEVLTGKSFAGARIGLARYGAECAILFFLYYGTAHLSYALRFAGPVGSIVWLPVGVGIAFLYLRGLRFWPGVLFADLVVNNYMRLPALTALGQTFGNVMEVVLAAWLLGRLITRERPFESIRSVLGMFGAIAAGTLVSATVGPLSVWLGGAVSAGAFPRIAASWWLGDFCGAAIVVPSVLAWWHPARHEVDGSRPLETALLVGVLVALNVVGIAGTHPVSYVTFPALMWAALRFGPRGATSAITVTAAFMIWGTKHYLGWLGVMSIDRSLVETQFFVAVTTVATLLVAALGSEREQLATATRISRRRIVVAADEERRRIERDLHDGAQGRLTALSARLSLAAREAERSPDTAAGSLEAAKEEVLLSIDELRELVHGIHPSSLRKFGLARAVEDSAARSRTPVELLELPTQRLDETAEATAYYVVLEALNNAQRYAGATSIQVRAHLNGGTLEVEVADDGVGGAVEQSNLGLQGLRDRVEATGGRFEVESAPGHGTRIAAEIPARPTAGPQAQPPRLPGTAGPPSHDG
ncbi:MAG TPA: MASE1 domain-containing protein [Solirubrobacteraceae bacterium]|nr:MASE1 domain-containing protein [Solirubrobacteraceae bacterium]